MRLIPPHMITAIKTAAIRIVMVLSAPKPFSILLTTVLLCTPGIKIPKLSTAITANSILINLDAFLFRKPLHIYHAGPPKNSSPSLSLYAWPKTPSKNETADPNIPKIQIQKMAPGPPVAIAEAMPAILPTPTRAPKAVMNAWNGEIPSSFFPLLSLRAHLSCFANLNWGKTNRIVKNKPPNKINAMKKSFEIAFLMFSVI